MQVQHQPHVSTIRLFGYLATVLSWQLEAGVILLHLFVEKKLDPLAHVLLVSLSLALTAFTYFRGKQDFALLDTGGRIPLTPAQCVLVTIFMIVYGNVMGMTVMRLLSQ